MISYTTLALIIGAFIAGQLLLIGLAWVFSRYTRVFELSDKEWEARVWRLVSLFGWSVAALMFLFFLALTVIGYTLNATSSTL